MSNVFIIHSYNADTKDSFGPYVTDGATKMGFNVIYPEFPIIDEAKYDKWTELMDKYLLSGELNEDSTVICHSLGTHFIPRYIAERGVSIKCLITVAGFITDHSGIEKLQAVVADYISTEEQRDKTIELTQSRYALYSDNDHLNPKEELERFAKRYKAQGVFIPGAGHFGARSGIKEVPEILEIIGKVYNINQDKKY